MCRWLAYSGSPILLEDLLFGPKHSLIDQSLSAHDSPTTTNGDGFGIAWYAGRETPGMYRNVRPAWNDRNLRDIAGQIEAPIILAHVRAATGTAIQQTNCHPFRCGPWLFVHNGEITGFRTIKRDLALAVAPELYANMEGTTDSEIMFHLALTHGLEDDPLGGLQRMVSFVETVGRDHGIEHTMQMTVGLTDGRRMIAARYSSEGRSRTLYVTRRRAALRDLVPDADDRLLDAQAIVSEPLGGVDDLWGAVPEATAVMIEAGDVSLQPFEPSAG